MIVEITGKPLPESIPTRDMQWGVLYEITSSDSQLYCRVVIRSSSNAFLLLDNPAIHYDKDSCGLMVRPLPSGTQVILTQE